MDAPIVSWYNGEDFLDEMEETIVANTQEMTSWNAGIIDAGSASRSTNLADPDPDYYPCTFLIWNNRGGAAAISSMQSVQVSTLSLVRAVGGEIDPNNSYLPEGSVAGGSSDPEKRAHVEIIFFNETKGTSGEWGYYNSSGVWVSEEWATIEGGTKIDIVSASGIKNIISGAINDGLIADSANYSKIKMRLVVNPDAQAGQVEWYTRVSYNYDGIS
jgi:hypothetical protein